MCRACFRSVYHDMSSTNRGRSFFSVTVLDTYLYIVGSGIFCTVFAQIWCFLRLLSLPLIQSPIPPTYHSTTMAVHPIPNIDPPTLTACMQPILHLNRWVSAQFYIGGKDLQWVAGKWSKRTKKQWCMWCNWCIQQSWGFRHLGQGGPGCCVSSRRRLWGGAKVSEFWGAKKHGEY